MKKVLFLVPHLSTGGMPQYTYDLMRKIINEVDVYCVEYSMVSPHFIVQRNRVIQLLGDKFFSLGEDKEELFSLIQKINPDILHLQEIPEYFLDSVTSRKLYSDDREYLIVETSHDSSFDSKSKRFYPDHFALISEYQKIEFSKLGIPISIVEADIEYKERQNRTEGLLKLGLDPKLKHVLNVGLFTPRKNQAEAIEYARKLEGYPIQFHFVGNQADNFKDYWEPLLQNLPSNVKIWGERSDVDIFYSCMDLMLFTSRGTGNDKETSPLVIREAIGYRLPSLIFNLPVYLGMYDKFESVSYMDFDDKKINVEMIMENLGLEKNLNTITTFTTLNGDINFESLEYSNSMFETIQKYGDAAGMWWGTFIHKELDRGNIRVEEGDVFVDLGANIGISSYYASKNGAGKIYCFEPDKNVLDLLEKNLGSTCKTFNYAVSNKRETIELYHWPYNSVNQGKTYKVQTVTLEDVFQMVGEPIIDYLKMDIEGFEETVFNNVSKNILNRIRKIFIEHHYPDNTSILVEILEKNGFDVHMEYGNGQNYLYCMNKNLDYYQKNSAEVYYDKTSNKLEFKLNETRKDILVSAKDIDSHAVIWSSKYEILHGNYFFWMIPIPKQSFDFETQEQFGGVLFDIYENDKLIFSKTIRIKEIPIRKEITKILNNSEPTFLNHREFFVDKIYNRFLEGKTFNTVVDVGANVGLWTEYVRNVSNVEKVYMVEPNANAIDILKKTYQDFENIHIVETAMSDFDGKLELFTNSDNSLISSIISEHKNGGFGSLVNSVYVNSMRFDSFVKKYQLSKIDLMKIDIEGAEYDLFDSMDVHDFGIIQNILVEYHLSQNRTLERDVKNIVKRFEELGFSCDLEIAHGTGGFIFATRSGDKINLVDNSSIRQDYTIQNVDKNTVKNLSKNEFNYSFNKLSTSHNAKIAIVTLYDSYYNDLGEISIPNKIEYAEKHGYDFIYFDSIIDKHRPPQWSKIKAIQYILGDYDWVWWIDIDAMIMNHEIKLETIIDKNYDIILTENKYSTISNGSSFFRNTQLTKQFLHECYSLERDILKNIDIHTFDHEQKPMRELYLNLKEYSSKIKLINERICNSYWYTQNESVLSNYPNWNSDDNIYRNGDFVINFCGRTKEERVIIMKDFEKKLRT